MRQIFGILLIIVAIGTATQCHWKQPMMTYNYTDQNNNRFFISETELRYTPITPEESSSGTYSGGEKKTVTLTQGQFAEISALVEAVFSAQSTHTNQRRMMTSILSTTFDGESNRVTLKKSKVRTQLETYLARLLKSE